MPTAELLESLRSIHVLEIRQDVPLAACTRFAIGGPADLFAVTDSPEGFTEAVRLCRRFRYPCYVLGDGTNVVVSDDGFRGLVLRFAAREIRSDGLRVEADAGAPLSALVEFTIEAGFEGLHTLTGIPGSVGAAIYGNAGAYGHSMHEFVEWVRFFDGEAVSRLDNAGCEFEYRESIFKRHKDWTIFGCGMVFTRGDTAKLRKAAAEIRAVRDAKFPPVMRCAGSIFKNLYLKDLPAAVARGVPEHAVREGKVASAYFLEKVGAKGMQRGGIRIAGYHANLIYNAGGGTASELRSLIFELKRRVREQFGFEVQEEVQYLGEFNGDAPQP